MNKTVLAVVMVLLIVVVGGLLVWYFVVEKSNGDTNQATNTEVLLPPKNTVWIVNGNFTPAVVTVRAGDKITWINKDEYKRRVASDPHPDLNALPDLVSSDLGQGDSFSFSFTSAGEWGYHDYLNPIKKGKIVVQ